MRPDRRTFVGSSLLAVTLLAACGGSGAAPDGCAAGAGTGTLTGTVYAPQGVDPVPNALVYVPGAAVQPFAPGVACSRCADAPSGAPVASTRTDANGAFTLTGVPAGSSQPLVIQVGRWRRQVAAPAVTACGTTPVAAGLTRLPRNKSEGDIPLMAIVTGAADGPECVLRKMGVADSEFTGSGGTGRVHLFTGSAGAGSGGASAPGSLGEAALLGTLSVLDRYDLVLMACQGVRDDRSAAELANVRAWVDAGGRLLATHEAHPLLSANAPFSTTATWNAGQPAPPDQAAFVDADFAKGRALSTWLTSVGASTTAGQLPLRVLKHDLDAVVAPGRRWLSVNDATQGVVPVLYGFNAPVGAAQGQACGRVLFSDFHPAEMAGSGAGTTFPAECAAGAMTAQEKLLEFMLLDLGNCVEADAP